MSGNFEFTEQYEALSSQAEYQAYRASGDEEEEGVSYLPSNNVEYF